MGYLWTKYLKIRFLGLVPLVTRPVQKVALKSVENWGFGLAQVIYYYDYVHAIILVLDKREKLKKKLNKRRIFTVQNKKSGIEFN